MYSASPDSRNWGDDRHHLIFFIYNKKFNTYNFDHTAVCSSSLLWGEVDHHRRCCKYRCCRRNAHVRWIVFTPNLLAVLQQSDGTHRMDASFRYLAVLWSIVVAPSPLHLCDFVTFSLNQMNIKTRGRKDAKSEKPHFSATFKKSTLRVQISCSSG